VALASKNEAASVHTFERDALGALRPGPPARLITAAEVEGLGISALVSDPFLPASIRDRAGALGIAIAPLRLRARILLELARDAVPIDPLALTPDYAREAEAVTKWRQMKGK